MEFQSLFSGKKKKSISNCCLLKFLPSLLSFKMEANFILLQFSLKGQRKLQYTSVVPMID